MHYLFSGFRLDTDLKELYFDETLVSLTKQNYKLLLFFVQTNNSVIDREVLMDKVWTGKVVTTNSIDQAVVNLKKKLLDAHEGDYFENIYGHGVKFLQNVEVVNPSEQELSIDPVTNTSESKSESKYKSKKSFLLGTLALLIIFSLIIYGYWWLQPKISQSTYEKQLLLVLPNEKVSDGTDEWLQSSSPLLIEQLLSLSNGVNLKKYEDKPKNLSTKEYLENQWKLSPDLKVVTSDVSLLNNVFTVSFSIVNKQQEVTQQKFMHQNLQVAYQLANEWLAEQINDKNDFSIDVFKSDNPYVLELYMRGLAAMSDEKADKAIRFFELCLDENPDYHLATLQLSKMARRAGDQTKALALLDTLTAVSTNENLLIQVVSLRSSILLRQGKLDEVKTTLVELLVKYADKPMFNTISAQYILAQVYKAQSENNLAKQSAIKLEKVVLEAEDFITLSQLYIFQSALYRILGETDKAQDYANKGLELYSKQGDLVGVSKSYSVLGRIAKSQAKLDEAAAYFSKALAINKSIGYKFGYGAVLNEMINLFISQGKLNQAWEFNQEMGLVAVEIDFSAMLLASKQLSIEISLAQKKWETTKFYLQEHLQLVNISGNKRGLFYNKVLEIDYKISTKQADGVDTLIAQQQAYLDKSQEETLQSWLNIQIVRYYFLIDNPVKALSVLNSALLLAEKIKNGENIIALNNLLADYYLDLKEPNKVLAVLEGSQKYNPNSVPFLILKSKAYVQLQQLTKAIEFAHISKRQANDLWTVENEAFLASLISEKLLQN